MCGIFGVINGTKNRYTNMPVCRVIEQAFVTGSLRGMDSSGLMQVDKRKIYEYKRAITGSEFVKDELTSAYFRDVDSSWLTVGHNRAATLGEITDANAHPFTVTNSRNNMLIGVHNGTLTGWEAKNKDKNITVDSQWALSLIAEEGVDAFEKIQGAFCFVWYTQEEPDYIYIARNTQRPMYLMYVKDQDRMLFASEWRMMAWLANRNDLALEDQIIDVSPMKLYKINIKNPREFTTYPLPYYKYTTTTTVNRGGGGWTAEEWEEYWEGTGTRGRNAWQYDDNGKRYVSEFIAMLTAKKDEEKGAEKDTPKSTEPLRAPVTAEEVRLAKSAECFDTVVTFTPVSYNEQSKELWGDVVSKEGDKYGGVLRNVPKADFDRYRLVTGGLQCRVVGASTVDNGDVVKELTLVLTRHMKPMDSDEAEKLADAVSREISEFVESKNRENKQVLH